MKAYSNKNFDEAIEFFKRFIALRPREPRGYYNLAIVQYRRKEYSAAKSNAEKAAKLGARAARKILQKIKKKQLKSKASSSGPATAVKQKPRKRRTAAKGSRAGGKKRKKKTAPAQPPGSGSAAESTISTPEPVESRETGGSIGDIADYDTATFDIAEVLGHDPVVWDADDMEEEVDTSEIQSPLIGSETGDDVIVFESATTADTAKSAAPGSQQPIAGPPDTVASSDSLAGRSAKQTKAKSAGSGEVPGSDVFALGLAASEKKEYLKAIRYFKKFTELLPNDPRGYYNLAVVSYRLKSYQTAREHAKRAQELGSKPAAKILTKLKSIQVAA
jgi:tetratricopeptide (TPR) repeat protein